MPKKKKQTKYSKSEIARLARSLKKEKAAGLGGAREQRSRDNYKKLSKGGPNAGEQEVIEGIGGGLVQGITPDSRGYSTSWIRGGLSVTPMSDEGIERRKRRMKNTEYYMSKKKKSKGAYD